MAYIYPVFFSDWMTVQYAASFTDYGGKQLVPAYLQGEQLAKMIAAVLVQLEKSGRFVVSVQGTYIRIYDHMICEMCEV